MSALFDNPGMRRCLCGHLEAAHRLRPRNPLASRGECLQCACGRFGWNNMVELPVRPAAAPATPPPASGARPAAGGELLTAALSLALHTANKRLLELGDRMGAAPVPGCVCLVCAPVPPPARARARDVLDDIERYAADYRCQHRLPADTVLRLVVNGGMSRLLEVAGDRLKLPGDAMPADCMLTWLRARRLELERSEIPPFGVVVSPRWQLLIYSPDVVGLPYTAAEERTTW